MLDSWALALESANRSGHTVVSYMLTGRQFCDYLEHHSMPQSVNGVDAPHIRRFLVACLQGCWKDEDLKVSCDCGIVPRTAGNAAKHWRNLRAFFYWLIKEGDRTRPHPMANVQPPTVPDNPPDVFADEELRALLKACSGSTHADRRDTAILRILMDTGLRIAGITDIRYDPDPDKSDVLLKQKLLRVRLKGGDTILVPIGKNAARDLDRYIRARARHADADCAWLWLGKKGRLNKSGIQQMLKRRGKQASVRNVHAHRFRHTMADDWLEAGGSEADLMRIAGWKSREMVGRYGRAAADRRAQASHARLSPGDRI
ncbi:tyrosine-type recombinase/integrase [Nonomuraea typhae]|uniref:Tyrosine-type recombinase/integrase n=1 Tax=Nonomuraea typhae TaxID=2603600 RepID=A0ABW7YLQ0_9ACTN